jgi:dienelactone hydrolase/lysophospholipase L1-like esterase
MFEGVKTLSLPRESRPMLMLRSVLAVWLLSASSLLAQQPPAKTELPRVLLLGDSIRMGYAPLVAKKLEGVAIVVHPEKENGGDTTTTLQNLDKWLEAAKPHIVHWNNGLHDLKFDKAKKVHQVPLEDYKKNLGEIADRLLKAAPGHVVFAATTPIVDDRHAARKANFDRFEKDVLAFNAAAKPVLLAKGIPVHDLHRIVVDGGVETMLGKDGTHYTPAANDRLANAVADCIRRQLAVRAAANAKLPAEPKATATEEYKKAEAEQDALVPAPFKNLKVPAFPVPKTESDWKARREDVKAKVVASLGDMPARPSKPQTQLVSVEHRPGYTLERLKIANGLDGEMSCLMLIPDKRTQPAPTILWLHSSSYDHTQLLMKNTNGGEEPLGETLVKKGYVVCAPDAAWYGDRAGQGPAGSRETTANQQSSLLKYHLWFGRTLWGMFVRDDQIALDYLVSRPEVDAKKIGVTGMSMGSTRSWWLAAVDDRVAAVVGVACLTHYETFIKHGQLRAHGVYYFVNGILKHFDTEAVVALIAPRPLLFLTGDLDAGSPADGIRIIEQKSGGVYKALGAEAKFQSILYPNTGHVYTPEMRKQMLAWFDRWLK